MKEGQAMKTLFMTLIAVIWGSLAFSQTRTIDGTVKDNNGNNMEGVQIVFSNGGGTATTDISGFYSHLLSTTWTGTATPSKIGYTFSPASKNYTPSTTDRLFQNYTGVTIYAIISGNVTNSNGNNMEGVLIAFSNGGGTATTNSDGFYTHQRLKTWSGIATPSRNGYTFSPTSKNYVPSTADRLFQNYTGITIFTAISGYVTNEDGNNMEGVAIEFSNGGGTTTTNSDGFYSLVISKTWSGTATPSRNAYTFSPTSRTYTASNNERTNQNYTGSSIYAIVDGYVKNSDGDTMQGVNIEFSNGGGSATTNSDGYYSKLITKGWIGTGTPSRNGYTFSPEFRTYSPLNSDNINQDYTGSSIYAFYDGYITDCSGQGLKDVRIDYSNGAGPPTYTNEDGYYYNFVVKGWSGSATPFKEGFTFTPTLFNYTANTTDKLNQNFAIVSAQHNEDACAEISGYIRNEDFLGVADVLVSFGDFYSSVKTDQDGFYKSPPIRKGWIGTITPTLTDFTFSPGSRTFSPLDADMVNQNFSALSKFISVSGWIRDSWNNAIDGVAVSFDNGGNVAYTDGIGYYQIFILRSLESVATPTKQNYTFDPPNRTHDGNGNEEDQNFSAFSTLSSEDSSVNIVDNFTVLPAYPNPFNPSTTISYGLDHDNIVDIDIYDISGKLITTLFEGRQIEGWHSISWNGTNQRGNKVPAGLYITRITAGIESKTQKIMLLK